jgi:hypothetical protein
VIAFETSEIVQSDDHRAKERESLGVLKQVKRGEEGQRVEMLVSQRFSKRSVGLQES